jgi:hypothetical protein
MRGNRGEAQVLAALVKRGLDVLVPFGDGHPYDLVVAVGGRSFLRVQCKTAWSHRGCLVFNSQSTDHGRGPQSYVGLADIFGVYFPPGDAIYLVPIGSVAETQGRLRLVPARNNQTRRVRPASKFEIGRWTPTALAELVA